MVSVFLVPRKHRYMQKDLEKIFLHINSKRGRYINGCHVKIRKNYSQGPYFQTTVQNIYKGLNVWV